MYKVTFNVTHPKTNSLLVRTFNANHYDRDSEYSQHIFSNRNKKKNAFVAAVPFRDVLIIEKAK